MAFNLLASPQAQSCEAGPIELGACRSLLQAGRNNPRRHALSRTDVGPRIPIAGTTLPQHLYDLGLELFKSEAVLESVISSTSEVSTPYAGVDVVFRLVNGDGVDADCDYGLDSLMETASKSSGMVNMLDVGGNYGRVTIAAFKKYPEEMRIVVAEPSPLSYFLLKWDLWLNKVTELTEEDFEDSTSAGVLALNVGITGEKAKVSGLCYEPPETMRAYVCGECLPEDLNQPGEDGVQCFPMEGSTLDSLFAHFGDEAISFLKMDCEGCEHDLIPALKKSGRKVVRFGGELHTEDPDFNYVCNYENGKWFVSSQCD